MIHYDIAMGVIEIIQNVACDNHHNFQHVNFISSQKKEKKFHYLEDYLMMKLTLIRVR
jgi:hypothetical protein